MEALLAALPSNLQNLISEGSTTEARSVDVLMDARVSYYYELQGPRDEQVHVHLETGM